MKSIKIYNNDDKYFIRIFSPQDVINVNPIEYFRNHEIEKRKILYRDILESKIPGSSQILSEDFFYREALNGIDEFLEQFNDLTIHENFIKLLKTARKKDQIVLLKGLTLNPSQLHTLFIESFKQEGYLLTRIFSEILPSTYDNKKLPKFFELNEDGSVYKIGDTDLSDGELKNIITQRKVIISNFLTKGNTWHCFFSTMKGISGEENYKGGQAHFHYISSAFGISKEEFIQSIKTGKYKSSNIHIDLFGYREK